MPTREDFENEKPHEYTEKELSWIQKMFDKILNQQKNPAPDDSGAGF